MKISKERTIKGGGTLWTRVRYTDNTKVPLFLSYASIKVEGYARALVSIPIVIC